MLSLSLTLHYFYLVNFDNTVASRCLKLASYKISKHSAYSSIVHALAMSLATSINTNSVNCHHHVPSLHSMIDSKVEELFYAPSITYSWDTCLPLRLVFKFSFQL
uniref:Uncharacterized protein n=1 Tax=Cacopsylla melanoneura TaxID=428564 RepID=A0A8D8LQ44_9HEMI